MPNNLWFCIDNFQDEDPNLEPPETPAPVFAARALKSAFFGTPGPPADDTTIEVETKIDQIAGKDTRSFQHRNISPTKPPGILLTPGTATARRKTVSFGSEVPDKSEKIVEGETAAQNKQNLPSQKLQAFHKPTRKTPLTRTLERAREAKSKKHNLERNRRSSGSQRTLIDLGQDINGFADTATTQPSTTKPSTSQASNQELLLELVSGDDIEGDVTLDLNEPHSRSGKYWKSEYEQYHSEAKAEMQKLVRYKLLAKSYAQKTDAEKLELTEKLKEQQHQVVAMEDRISKLCAQISTAGFEGTGDESSDLVKELARQTALAQQYKAQVEEFRDAMDGTTAKSTVGGGDGVLPLRTEENLADTRRELRIAREQLKDSASLRKEMRDLREALSSAERTSSKLQAENAKLTQELVNADLRLEEQKNKSEKRRQETEEQLQKKVEAFKSLQQDYNTLKEKMKAQRGNAENILREKHEQAVQLRKELASMRRAEVAAKNNQEPLQKQPLEQEPILARSRKPPARVEDGFGGRLVKEPAVVGEERVQVQKSDPTRNSHHSTNISKTRESLIPALSPLTSDQPKNQAYSRQTQIEAPCRSPAVQVPHAPLIEVVNNADLERHPFGRTGPVAHTPLAHRTTNIADEIPGLELPSPEPSVSYITGHKPYEKKVQPSPRPSMFTFTASPPKSDRWPARTSDVLHRQRLVNNPAGEGEVQAVSTRLSSLDGSRARETLPPDRAAAARARLEKKMAERRRAREAGVGKENIPN